jgi:hypothetical protein
MSGLGDLRDALIPSGFSLGKKPARWYYGYLDLHANVDDVRSGRAPLFQGGASKQYQCNTSVKEELCKWLKTEAVDQFLTFDEICGRVPALRELGCATRLCVEELQRRDMDPIAFYTGPGHTRVLWVDRSLWSSSSAAANLDSYFTSETCDALRKHIDLGVPVSGLDLCSFGLNRASLFAPLIDDESYRWSHDYELEDKPSAEFFDLLVKFFGFLDIEYRSLFVCRMCSKCKKSREFLKDLSSSDDKLELFEEKILQRNEVLRGVFGRFLIPFHYDSSKRQFVWDNYIPTSLGLSSVGLLLARFWGPKWNFWDFIDSCAVDTAYASWLVWYKAFGPSKLSEGASEYERRIHAALGAAFKVFLCAGDDAHGDKLREASKFIFWSGLVDDCGDPSKNYPSFYFKPRECDDPTITNVTEFTDIAVNLFRGAGECIRACGRYTCNSCHSQKTGSESNLARVVIASSEGLIPASLGRRPMLLSELVKACLERRFTNRAPHCCSTRMTLGLVEVVKLPPRHISIDISCISLQLSTRIPDLQLDALPADSVVGVGLSDYYLDRIIMNSNDNHYNAYIWMPCADGGHWYFYDGIKSTRAVRCRVRNQIKLKLKEASMLCYSKYEEEHRPSQLSVLMEAPAEQAVDLDVIDSAQVALVNYYAVERERSVKKKKKLEDCLNSPVSKLTETEMINLADRNCGCCDCAECLQTEVDDNYRCSEPLSARW